MPKMPTPGKVYTIGGEQWHQDLHLRLTDAYRGFGDKPSIEILLVFASYVGQMTAYMDQREFTIERVLSMVHQAILQGNADIVKRSFEGTDMGTKN